MIRPLIALSLVSTVAACGSKPKKVEQPTEQPAASVEAPAPEPAVTKTEEPADPAPAAENEPQLGTIFFDFDSSELTAPARDQLAENVEWLKKHPNADMVVEGHTDPVGTEEYNIALGEMRARAAMDYLIRMGIDKKRLRTLSFGEDKPVASEDEKNRRAEFRPKE